MLAIAVPVLIRREVGITKYIEADLYTGSYGQGQSEPFQLRQEPHEAESHTRGRRKICQEQCGGENASGGSLAVGAQRNRPFRRVMYAAPHAQCHTKNKVESAACAAEAEFTHFGAGRV